MEDRGRREAILGEDIVDQCLIIHQSARQICRIVGARLLDDPSFVALSVAIYHNWSGLRDRNGVVVAVPAVLFWHRYCPMLRVMHPTAAAETVGAVLGGRLAVASQRPLLGRGGDGRHAGASVLRAYRCR